MSPFLFLSLVSNAQLNPVVPKNTKAYLQTISVKMTFQGDLNEVYQFTGPLGESLIGNAEKPNPVCENKALFRHVIHQNKKSIEVWLNLTCLNEGQKQEYKVQRFFIEPKSEIQTLTLPPLSVKFKKVQVLVEDASIKSPKKK